MTQEAQPAPGKSADPSFLDAANNERPGLIADFWSFLKENKKWWLIPFLVMFSLVGIVVILGAVAPGAVPFLYTLF